MLKLLHAADLHLDSPFSAENTQMAEMRRGELRSTFVNLMMYAKENEVNLLLLSGDLFDTDHPDRQTLEMVEREFTAAGNRGVQIFIAPGNHDPYRPDGKSIWEKLTLPANVHLFTSYRLEKKELPSLGVTVWGYAFSDSTLFSNPFAEPHTVDTQTINILCGHGDLESSSGNCPITPAQIRCSGFDYLALGHIHKGSGLQKEGESYYAYPGCLEGRDFGECGEKGAIFAIAEKENGRFRMDAKFIRFSKRRYEQLDFDVSGIETNEEFSSRLNERLKTEGCGSDTLLRLNCVGRASPHIRISQSVLHGFSERLGYLELRDKTMPEGAEETLLTDPTVRGEFYRALLPIFQNGTSEEKEIAASALRYGLLALDGGDVTDF